MIWALLLACGAPTYIVEGTVVDVGSAEVVIDHQRIEGFMGPMVMPFPVVDEGILDGLEPGDRVIGRIRVDATRTELERIRVVGKGPPPARDGPAELEPGEVLPRIEVELEDGTRAVLGEGQGVATAVTFLYTRCPDPAYCPATVARLQALQTEGGRRLVAVSLDPDRDTPEVLRAYGAEVGADPARWRFARVDRAELRDLAMRSGLAVSQASGGEVVHSIRWLLLDAEGRLEARHDGNDW